MIGGGLPDGYRLTRSPVALKDVHTYLERGSEFTQIATESARVA